MNFESVVVDRLLFLQWTGIPAVSDIDPLETAIVDAARQCGGRIVIVAVHRVLAPPTSGVRVPFEAFLHRVRKYIELISVVIGGEGIGPTLIRTAVRGTLLVTGLAARTKIAADVGQAMRFAAPALGTSASELEQMLGARGTVRVRAAV